MDAQRERSAKKIKTELISRWNESVPVVQSGPRNVPYCRIAVAVTL